MLEHWKVKFMYVFSKKISHFGFDGLEITPNWIILVNNDNRVDTNIPTHLNLNWIRNSISKWVIFYKSCFPLRIMNFNIIGKKNGSTTLHYIGTLGWPQCSGGNWYSSMKKNQKDSNYFWHRLRMPSEEIAFNARPKIHSNSQIFRYGRSIFCLPHRPSFSDIVDLCLHWVSVVRDFWL